MLQLLKKQRFKTNTIDFQMNMTCDMYLDTFPSAFG